MVAPPNLYFTYISIGTQCQVKLKLMFKFSGCKENEKRPKKKDPSKKSVNHI